MTRLLLRDGSEVKDPRLGSIPNLNPAARGWQVRPLLEQRDYRTSAWKYWIPGPTLDQLQEGQCVSEAGHDARNGSPLRSRPTVTDFAERSRVYHELQHLDPWSGCAWGDRCPISPDAANAYGGTDVDTLGRYGRDKGWWKEFRWIGAGSGRLEDDLIQTLANIGGIIFAVPWFEGMYETSESGLVTVEGELAGYHAIHGWEWAPRQRMPRHWSGTKPGVWWHNSWGDSYGVERRGVTGCGFVPLDDLLRLLEQHGGGMVPL